MFASRFADFGQDGRFSASVEGCGSPTDLDSYPSSENAKELDATQAFRRKGGRQGNDVVNLLFSRRLWPARRLQSRRVPALPRFGIWAVSPDGQRMSLAAAGFGLACMTGGETCP